MDESILNSVKAMLGGNLSGDDTAFDAELLPIINMALNALVQLGAGPSQGYKVTGPENVWSEFIGDDAMLEPVKEYVLLKTKLLFDNSTMTGSVIEIYKLQIQELEFRVQCRVDPKSTFK